MHVQLIKTTKGNDQKTAAPVEITNNKQLVFIVTKYPLYLNKERLMPTHLNFQA
ncbi:hypothetical protein PESP_a3495 [Pseudoalteromonas espejiana DSM 9414]|uniref:Uncharacterized protein n=1 Tax=Pseudoalteromonas espejiana TaxID=28107 RepID=A0A510XXF1_9GAMM|nr:hypothetical protein PESP_a3495 [Pseudoalteromonas espejiana DSM 9414]GEK55609.1 hypothetical protein PES01_24540 [Pseudoalteromonas espejiana]